MTTAAGPRSSFRPTLAAVAAVAVLGACAAPSMVAPPPGGAPSAPVTAPKTLWRSESHIVLVTSAPATSRDLAEEYLKDPDLGWRIEAYNGRARFAGDEEVVIPLADRQPLGILRDGYQVVPILCYHRFGSDLKNKLVISAADFDRQMAYLRDNGYSVVRLSRLEGFLEGRVGLPTKSVVITVDDGFKSVMETAFPILRKYGFPATLFVYTDYVGAGPGALGWDELKKMQDSGLIDIQSHTKTHADLTTLGGDKEKIRAELLVPLDLITRKLGRPVNELAYPYGATNPDVVALARESGLRLALTVDRGGNAFFQNPYMLRRTMVFSGEDFNRFLKFIAVKEPLP